MGSVTVGKGALLYTTECYSLIIQLVIIFLPDLVDVKLLFPKNNYAPILRFDIPCAISRFVYVYFWVATQPFGICRIGGALRI